MTIYSETIDGEEYLYTEGYSPNVENSSNSNLSLNSIDPNDNRKPISNPKISPYLSIGRTVAKYYNIKNNINGAYYTILSSGTGFLEGPNIMATAAHCTYGDVTVEDFDDGKNNPRLPDVLEFYPGLNGTSELDDTYSYYCKAKIININIDYFINMDSNNDWAAIELDRNIGYSTGWNGKIANWYNTSSQVFSYGYPGDKNDTMWSAEGKIQSKVNDYIYKTNVYGVGGQSGSPYFMTNSNSTYVWGILTQNYTYDKWETISGTEGVCINTFIFHYLNSFVTNHNVIYEVATIKPNNYGFADAYPIDDATKNNFIQHQLSNGFTFRTRRYRTGYIQQEYIVMSCIKTNITEAFIEYQFDIPVYRIDVDLTHWRPYSNEWLDKEKGISELQVWHDKDWWNPFDSSRWIQKMDLLSIETNLPTDRTNPTTYTITFDSPVTGFRFYSKINNPEFSNNNRGRICIGDMKIYTRAD